MTNINLHNRRFRMLSTSTGDEAAVNGTMFHYYQDDNVVWGTYAGGSVQRGSMIGSVDENGVLTIRFQHLYTDGRFRSGESDTTVEVLEDGRYRLHETYTFFDDGSAGESAVEEIIAHK